MESAPLNSLPRQRIEANARTRGAEGRGADRPACDEAGHEATTFRAARVSLGLSRARGYPTDGGRRSRGRDTGGGKAHFARTSPTRHVFPSTWVGNCKRFCYIFLRNRSARQSVSALDAGPDHNDEVAPRWVHERLHLDVKRS